MWRKDQQLSSSGDAMILPNNVEKLIPVPETKANELKETSTLKAKGC